MVERLKEQTKFTRKVFLKSTQKYKDYIWFLIAVFIEILYILSLYLTDLSWIYTFEFDICRPSAVCWDKAEARSKAPWGGKPGGERDRRGSRRAAETSQRRAHRPRQRRALSSWAQPGQTDWWNQWVLCHSREYHHLYIMKRLPSILVQHAKKYLLNVFK